MPLFKAPAGIVTVEAPALSVAAAEVKPPPVTTTVPVGTGEPAPPLTPTVKVSVWVVLMVDEDGVTVTDGMALATVTLGEVPTVLLYVCELDWSGV